MTFKLSSLALVAALTTAASAQTAPATSTAPHKTTTTHHASASTPASTLPKVAGIPKTLYSLKYIDTKIGTGDLALPHKWYTVHYTGYFPDGTKFDSSVDRGTPFTFPYGAHRVITGWDTGFQGMRIGGKRRLFVPYQLAYGELGNPPRMPAKANLVFDVEFISQSDTPPEQPRQPAPPQAAPPAPKPAPDATAPAAQPQTPPQAQPAPQPQAQPAPQPQAPAPPPTSVQPQTPPNPKGL